MAVASFHSLFRRPFLLLNKGSTRRLCILFYISENDPPPKYEEIYQSHIKPEDEEMPIERTESCQESTDDCHTEEENSNSVENSQDIATVSQNAAQIESSTCEDVGCHAESEDGDRFSYTTHL